MTIPNNFKSAPLVQFNAPKNNAYDPFKDYCYGNLTTEQLFGQPTTKAAVWSLRVENSVKLYIVDQRGEKYWLGDYQNLYKVSFCFDNRSYPIIALGIRDPSGKSKIQVFRVNIFTGGAFGADQLITIDNATSPTMCFSYDYDPGSVNNQPCLFYILPIGGSPEKIVTQMRSLDDNFATVKGGNIREDHVVGDTIQRAGMCINNTIQIEWARMNS